MFILNSKHGFLIVYTNVPIVGILIMDLPSHILHTISAIPSFIISSNQDQQIWNSNAVICSVKSAYRHLINSNHLVNHTGNWKLPIPPKLRIFKWKCINLRMVLSIIYSKKNFYNSANVSPLSPSLSLSLSLSVYLARCEM